MVIRTRGFPRRKTGTASNAALRLISLIIKFTRKIPPVKPRERIIVCKKPAEIIMHKKTETAVMPPGKFIKHSSVFLFFTRYLKTINSSPSYTIELTGNRIIYTNIPEEKEEIILEKINQSNTQQKKIKALFIKVTIFIGVFSSTVPLTPKAHCRTRLMVKHE